MDAQAGTALVISFKVREIRLRRHVIRMKRRDLAVKFSNCHSSFAIDSVSSAINFKVSEDL
jgi:hypothetical protein